MADQYTAGLLALRGDALPRRRRLRPARLALGLLAILSMFLFAACEPAPPAFPEAPFDSGSGRRLIYSVEQQRVWWVDEHEVVVNSYLVSGRANTPRPGTYQVFSKSRHTTSLNGASRMEFMVRFTWGNSAAIGFHSIPVDRRGRPLQSEAELGQYRSAGCIRQRYADAAGLYDFAHVGTTVVVVK